MAEYLIKCPDSPFKQRYDVGLVVPVFNRFNYVNKFLKSVAKSDLSDSIVAFADDVSDDERVVTVIGDFQHKDADCVVVRRLHRDSYHLTKTLHDNLSFTIKYLFYQRHCKYVCIIDSDTVVKPYWLKRLKEVYAREKLSDPMIVSGFNTINHPVIEKHQDYYHKKSLGGVNMFFDKDTYKKVFVPISPYWDEAINHRMSINQYPRLCTRPSVVQHMGYKGTFSFLLKVDIAYDYIYPPIIGLAFYYSTRGALNLLLYINRLRRTVLHILGIKDTFKFREIK